jgi:hypothetical protein
MRASKWPKPFAFLAAVGFAFGLNPILAQKAQDEVNGKAHAQTSSLAGPRLLHNADYRSAAGKDWASTRTRPTPFIEPNDARPFCISCCIKGRDIASSGKRLRSAERESTERNLCAVLRSDILERQWSYSRRSGESLANGQIHGAVELTIVEHIPMKVKSDRFALPSAVRNVDGLNARGESIESLDHVSIGKEMSNSVDEESGSLNQLNRELSFVIDRAANDRNDGVLYALNTQNESVAPPAPAKRRKNAKKHDAQESKDTSTDPHTSGTLSITNDGKAIGCETTTPSSATLAIWCPQIDPVALSKPTPQETKHDPPVQPPSQE